MRKCMTIAAAAAVVLACVSGAQADLVMETVTVGNPGNVGELSGEGAGGYGPDAIVGGVAYTYNIGKYEVTAGQYTEFLNAVADADTYGLYDFDMSSSSFGFKIERTGSSGSYAYNVAPDWAARPVNFVSWGDAARFANWMHNGQPTDAQGLSTTEDGSYFLNGAMTDAQLLAVTREDNATWMIPTEDEWYKAAYHKNDGGSGNYWDYPTGTDLVPNNGNPEGDTGNSVNYNDGDYTIASPYYRTSVGYFGFSESSFGMLDQGGNVREWNETAIGDWYRGVRGGFFGGSGPLENELHAAVQTSNGPGWNVASTGFRLAYIPEPITLSLFLLSGIVAVKRRR